MIRILRITGGELKGRSLVSPKGIKARPASSALREALFNIIREDLVGRSCIDLYAGVGTIGLEALSRGASSCVFVEKDKGTSRILIENIALCGFESRARVYTMDALAVLSMLDGRPGEFAFAFVDPPYEAGLLDKTLKKLGVSSIVAPDGTVVVQRSTREVVSPRVGRLELGREVKFGDTVLSFYWTAVGGC